MAVGDFDFDQNNPLIIEFQGLNLADIESGKNNRHAFRKAIAGFGRKGKGVGCFENTLSRGQV